MKTNNLANYNREVKGELIIGSRPIAIFLVYVLYIWLCELLDLGFFLVGLHDTYTVVSAILAALLSILIVLKIYKHISFEACKIDWLFWCGAAFIMMFGFYKGVTPDGATDTWNYHLLCQEPGFVNRFTESFGAGNFQIWGFRLGDRLFYFFRKVLGFRMGTSLNSLILVLAYFQLTQVMEIFNRQLQKQVSKVCIECFALFICLSQWSLLDLGTYYVDIIAFPIALEVIRLLMKTRICKPSQGEIIYFALLNGIWLAIKMTNVVFVFPAIVLFISYSRNIKLKTFILSGFACAIPSVVYLVYNWSCTGNPVFPYYNEIFKSPLFAITNWKDVRWGPETLLEKFTWLFHAIFVPEYRLAEIYDKFNLRYIIAIISIGILMVFCIIYKAKRKNIEMFHIELVLFVLGSSVLWGFSTGYGRYYMFGIMILELITFELVAIIYSEYLADKNVVSASLGLLSGVLLFYEFSLLTSVLTGTEWAWRNSYPLSDNVKNNLQYVFQDQDYEGSFDTSTIDAFVISSAGSCGNAYWLAPNAYIYNLGYLGQVSSEKQTYYLEILNDIINTEDEVYDIIGINTDMDSYAANMENYDIVVDTVTQNDTNVGSFLMVKLKALE